MQNAHKATLVGLTAILFWAAIVGLIRSVSDSFGAIGGGALIYTVGSLILLLTRGFPKLGAFPRRYLFWGPLLFVSYELCLALSIGFSQSSQQAIEVGMVNYLWPTFTLVAAVIFTKDRANGWIVPGFLLSMVGIVFVLRGDSGLNVDAIVQNVQSNPLSYGLALLGAFIWAAYSVVTVRIAEGSDGITLFFMLVALTLWVQYAFTGGGALEFTPRATLNLLLAGAAMGLGYAAWNVGILGGNMLILAGASYFVPVLSAVFAALWLQVPLSVSFWIGAGMVTAGSIISWGAVRAASRA